MLRYALVLLLLIFIARAFWRVVEGLIEGVTGQPRSTRKPRRGIQMARDPVCGTFVVPERAVILVQGQQHIHFCSTRCRDEYRDGTA